MTQKGKEIAKRAAANLKAAKQDGTFKGMSSSEIRTVLEGYQLAIQNALPTGSDPSRIIQSAVYAVASNPRLKDCTQASVLGCVLNAGLLNLDPALDHCFFVPYRNNATGATEAVFQKGYKGLLDLARRAGNVASVYARAVRPDDLFEYEFGSDQHLKHIPKLGDEREEFIAVYAFIRYTNGGEEFIILSPGQVEKRRLKSQNQKSEPAYFWANWKEEMWKKTALRVLLSSAQLSPAMAAALKTEGAVLAPSNFSGGQVRPETISIDSDHGSAPAEDEDINAIQDGVNDCSDLDALDKYWKQLDQADQRKEAVKALFVNRKKDLQK